MTNTITAHAGRRYGHVPGHSYLDADLECVRRGSRWIATITVTWGSAQGRGCDEEHARREYTATAGDAVDAIERVRDIALAEEDGDETPGYIHTSASRAIREACEDEAA